MFQATALSVLSITLMLAACSDDSHPAPSSDAASASSARGGDASAFKGGAASAPVPASGQPPLAPPVVHYPPAQGASDAEPPPGGPGNPGSAVLPGGAPNGNAEGDAAPPSAIPPSRLPDSGAGNARSRG